MTPIRTAIACQLVLAAALLAGRPAWGADFPPVTAEQKALASIPGFPNAAAVVIYKRGDLEMLDSVRRQQSSTLIVEARIKILNEQGKKDHGEIEIYHSSFYRLKNLSGRTVLADGRVLPLDEKSIFERRRSQSRRLSVTSAAFPGVEVGAILDYRYEIKFDSILYLEPWVFQDRIPVLSSAITYHFPKELFARGWSRDPTHIGIQTADEKNVLGTVLTVSAQNAAPLIDEPYGFPTIDLATRFMLIPTNYGGKEALLDTWATTCELFGYNYEMVQRNDTAARRRAKELTGKAQTPREQALALYRFVRDEIGTDPIPGVIFADGSPDAVLAARHGGPSPKALLLQTLLDTARLDASLVWAASRKDGIVDTTLPSVTWFDRTLVRVMLDGQPVFLDPSERGLAFGRLGADYEGTQALLYHRRKPEILTLPATGYADHTRKAKVVLALDEQGRLGGTGTVRMTGHHAENRMAAIFAEESPGKAWKDWLEARFESFTVSGVVASQGIDEGWVEVAFQLAQPEEEVLGDEATYGPSRPLGPVAQPFVMPPERRRTPVMFDFGDRNELEMELTWPAGWELGAVPDDKLSSPPVGSFATDWQVDREARKLVHHRVFEIHAAQFMGRNDYGLLRNLWALAEKSDSVAVVLAKRNRPPG